MDAESELGDVETVKSDAKSRSKKRQISWLALGAVITEISLWITKNPRPLLMSLVVAAGAICILIVLLFERVGEKKSLMQRLLLTNLIGIIVVALFLFLTPGNWQGFVFCLMVVALNNARLYDFARTSVSDRTATQQDRS